MSGIFETLILGLIGLWSLFVIIQKLLPQLSRSLRQALANHLKPQHPRLAAWFDAPPPSASGCAVGCHDCRPNCQTEKPVQWR